MLLNCSSALVEQAGLPEKELCACWIRVENGKITEIASHLPERGEEIIDLSGMTVLPGLIDTHIHGYAGFDTMDGDPQALRAMSRELLKAGVTAFLPTTMTAFAPDIHKALSAVGGLVEQETGGAKILGAFAEGPFISVEHRGAQPLDAISPVDIPLLEQMVKSSHGTLRKMIIAPEIPQAADCCRWMKEHGILPAIGHTSATWEQTMACVEAGASVSVHTFNGMKGLHHREPAVLGAVLGSDRILAELIFDGIHVHPEAARVLLRAKGSDEIVLISDCMRAGGMADGEYMLGDTKTFVKNGVARTGEGALAGSTLKLIDGVSNMIRWLGVSLAEAVKMASRNPARELGLEQSLGSIAKGKRAHIIAMDGEGNVRFAMVDGRIRLQDGQLLPE